MWGAAESRADERVFFDKDDLDVSNVADDQVKTVLIQRLTAIVSRARAWVVFAAALQPYLAGGDLQEAIARGLATQVNDVVVIW